MPATALSAPAASPDSPADRARHLVLVILGLSVLTAVFALGYLSVAGTTGRSVAPVVAWAGVHGAIGSVAVLTLVPLLATRYRNLAIATLLVVAIAGGTVLAAAVAGASGDGLGGVIGLLALLATLVTASAAAIGGALEAMAKLDQPAVR